MVVFNRPVGAQADAKEIEYISALHQSGERLRPDGSIRDEDIKVYLRSRFGIEVTLDEVRRTILQGLGGSDEEGEVIDLMELTAIILIPLLVKAAAVEKGQTLPEGAVRPPERLLENVIQIMMHDVTGSHDEQELSPELIKRIMKVYGEDAMAQDDELISEMMVAAGGAKTFDTNAFACALTDDVHLYDIENEIRISTSVQDVFEEDDQRMTGREKSEENRNEERSDPNGDARLRSSTRDALIDATEEFQLKKHSLRDIESLKRIYTAPAIDIQAGTYRSKALTVSLWGSVLFTLFYAAIEIQTTPLGIECEGDRFKFDSGAGWIDNSGAMFCQLGTAIIGWMFLFGSFCCVGVICMWIGSMGNYVGNTKWHLPLIGASFSLILGFIGVSTSADEKPPAYFRYVNILALVLSIVVAYFHLCHFVTIVFPNVDFETSKWGRRLGAAALGNELHVKTSGAHKLNQLVSNAARIMNLEVPTSVFKTYFGYGLSTFTTHGLSHEKAGGFMWFIRRVRDQSIFEKEGLWYSTRLVASNFAQIAISFFILILGISVIGQVKENFGVEKAATGISAAVDFLMNTSVSQEQTMMATTELTSAFSAYLTSAGTSGYFDLNCSDAAGDDMLISEICEQDAFGSYNCSGIVSPTESLCILLQNPDLPEQDPAAAMVLLEGAGFDSDSLSVLVRSQFETVINQATESMYPEELYMLTVPLSIAVIVAITTSLRLAMSYIPGVTTTILQLRAGLIPSLHSTDFEKYRVAPDTVTLLTGSLFWGCLVSSVLFGLVIGFVVFLFLWQGSVYFMMRIIAILLGVVCIVILRLLLVMFCCRKRFYKGFYRTRPAASNISLLALEWANFVFASAFILVRMLKLILIAVSSIGQIDRKLLADGVGQIGPLEFDPYPTIHLRDLVAHEAHRHPYIEILGTIYLMKLRYAKHFGNRAGSSWRLLFVYALLPWMHQYRIFDTGVIDCDDDESNKQTKKDATTASRLDDFAQIDDKKFESGVDRLLPWQQSIRLSSMNASINEGRTAGVMEIENARLKQMVKRLSKQLQEAQEKMLDDNDC